jgi:hypothetical protein
MKFISGLMLRQVLLSVFVAVLVTGCGTRSISNSGYYADSDRGYGQRSNPFYKGELSEFNVLGIDPKSFVSDAEIQSALASKQRISIPKGSSIMLIQSGAMIPDESMSKGLEKSYNVSIFTGVPEQSAMAADTYSRALRLAAARGGNERLVVYWGLLETGRENLATKAVSWVPFVGGLVPDETQRMRIRLTVAVVDVKTGQWEIFTPEPFEDVDTSGRFTRISSDQAQVSVLKDKGYRAAVEDLLKKYAR